MHRVEIVKPEKARRVEDSIIQAAQQRRLPGKVTEGAVPLPLSAAVLFTHVGVVLRLSLGQTP